MNTEHFACIWFNVGLVCYFALCYNAYNFIPFEFWMVCFELSWVERSMHGHLIVFEASLILLVFPSFVAIWYFVSFCIISHRTSAWSVRMILKSDYVPNKNSPFEHFFLLFFYDKKKNYYSHHWITDRLRLGWMAADKRNWRVIFWDSF